MEFKSSKIMLAQGRGEWYFEKHFAPAGAA